MFTSLDKFLYLVKLCSTLSKNSRHLSIDYLISICHLLNGKLVQIVSHRFVLMKSKLSHRHSNEVAKSFGSLARHLLSKSVFLCNSCCDRNFFSLIYLKVHVVAVLQSSVFWMSVLCLLLKYTSKCVSFAFAYINSQNKCYFCRFGEWLAALCKSYVIFKIVFEYVKNLLFCLFTRPCYSLNVGSCFLNRSCLNNNEKVSKRFACKL